MTGTSTCAVDGRKVSCSAPLRLATGVHRLVAGTESTAVTRTWTVDATPPIEAVALQRYTGTHPVPVTITAIDLGAAGVGSVGLESWAEYPGGRLVALATRTLTVHGHLTVRLPLVSAAKGMCVSVRAVDKVGNTAGWTPRRCLARGASASTGLALRGFPVVPSPSGGSHGGWLAVLAVGLFGALWLRPRRSVITARVRRRGTHR